MDKIEQLVEDSSFTLVLLYNERTRDFELIGLEPVPYEVAQGYYARNLGFAGVFGLVNGAPRVALEMPVDDARVEQAFVTRVEAEINSRLPKSESTAWLEKLYSMPDTREN